MADPLNTPTPAKTPVQRGWRSLFQAALGALGGLILAVWNVPGVPDVVVNYAQTNFLPLLLAAIALFGVPTAIVALVQNWLETKRRLGA